MTSARPSPVAGTYPLSEVVQVVLGNRKADALYRQICKDEGR